MNMFFVLSFEISSEVFTSALGLVTVSLKMQTGQCSLLPGT